MDIGDKEFATDLTYTGATRTKNLNLLAFDPYPNYHRLDKTGGGQAMYSICFRFAKIFLSKGFKARRKEEIRKQEMADNQL